MTSCPIRVLSMWGRLETCGSFPPATPMAHISRCRLRSIDMDVRVHTIGAGTDWFAVWLADDTTGDTLYSNSATLPGAAGYFGYLVMYRQNGRIQIYKQNAATLTNVYTDGPTFTADATTVYKVRVRVTPTEIIGEKLDTDGSVLQATVMTDSTYRGGYFSVHKLTNMRAMFRNMVVS
jgi:CRP-like cAMP-binding protein